MPARDAHRGRGSGRGGGTNRSTRGGGRQANAGAPASSTRAGSSRTAASSGAEPAGGRSSSRTTRTAQPSRTASSPAAGGAAAGALDDPRRRASSGIGAGDLTAGGVATTGAASASPPRAGDVDEGLFGASSPSRTAPPTERERDLEPILETGRTTGPGPASRSGVAQPGARVAGRAQPTAGLSAWLAGGDNPFAMMRRVEEDLESVLRAFGIPRLGAAFSPRRELEELLARTPALSQAARWSPQIEVFERDGNLVVHADLPGVNRDDIEVNVDNDVLTIRGERRQEHHETERGYRRTERSYGTFFRQIPLPEGVDPGDVEASCENGVLEVIVPAPRNEPQRRRRVDIR
jgi:HSP20 family protein